MVVRKSFAGPTPLCTVKVSPTLGLFKTLKLFEVFRLKSIHARLFVGSGEQAAGAANRLI